MSQDIVEKCKYIHPSRAEEIEQLLIRLRKHFLENQASPQESFNAEPKDIEHSRHESKMIHHSQIPQLPPARIEELDDYLEMLYQGK